MVIAQVMEEQNDTKLYLVHQIDPSDHNTTAAAAAEVTSLLDANAEEWFRLRDAEAHDGRFKG